MGKWLGRGLQLFGGFILTMGVLLVIGMIYEAYQSRQDLRDYIPPGKLYEVDGRNMHLYTTGTGKTTVVFASGWGTPNPYADFSPLYEKLRPYAKLAVYDRFGYGYSDYTDAPRDIDTMTREIHQLLKAAGHRPPFIIVGHSLGSLEVIRYAEMYPEEVAGIVMIDGGSPNYYCSEEMEMPEWYFDSARALIKTGVVRALLHSDKMTSQWVIDPDSVTEPMRKAATISTLKLAYNENMMEEMWNAQNNARRVLAERTEFSFPLTILTGGSEDEDDQSVTWRKDQADFAGWSGKGKQVFIPNADHSLHNSHPDVVVNEILRMLNIRDDSGI